MKLLKKVFMALMIILLSTVFLGCVDTDTPAVITHFTYEDPESDWGCVGVNIRTWVKTKDNIRTDFCDSLGAVGDTIHLELNGVANDGATFNFAGGELFPDGCFYDEDTNVTSTKITFNTEA